MGRQPEPSVLHSSITLLQERFRQLQRIKEMREERELLIKIFDESTPQPSEQPKWFVHPDLVHPSRPLHGFAATSTRRELAHGERREFQAFDTQLSMGLWPRGGGHGKNLSETEVDTSLHL